MKYPSFEDLAQVVRDSVRLKRDKRIDPDTQIFRDLELTGRRGIDLFKAVEKHYGIEFGAVFFDRVGQEASFHSEDPDDSPVIQSLLGKPMLEGHPFTVGELYRVVLQELRAVSEIRHLGGRAN